jgi:hypothetical protein
MAAAIESQCGKYIFTDMASRQGSFSMIGAGSCYQSGIGSNATSFTTAAGRSPDSRNSFIDKDWASMGHAAAAGAGGGSSKGDGGYAAVGSRGLPVWLATVLQIGGLFLLGMLGYVIACGFLEVSNMLFVRYLLVQQQIVLFIMQQLCTCRLQVVYSTSVGRCQVQHQTRCHTVFQWH